MERKGWELSLTCFTFKNFVQLLAESYSDVPRGAADPFELHLLSPVTVLISFQCIVLAESGVAYGDIVLDSLFTEFRKLDGSGNNLLIDEMGAAGQKTRRCIPPAYEDGYSSMAGAYRYNPRELSNVLSAQNPETSPEWLNDRFLTNFAWYVKHTNSVR